MSITRAAAFITCLGGPTPKTPTPPPPAPTQQDAGVVAAQDAERRRRRAVASNTVLTSYNGAAPVAVKPKTLLGQ